MVEKLTGAEKKVNKKTSKNKIKDLTKWNRKMGGKSCFITSGAFGHGLLLRHNCMAAADSVVVLF